MKYTSITKLKQKQNKKTTRYLTRGTHNIILYNLSSKILVNSMASGNILFQGEKYIQLFWIT